MIMRKNNWKTTAIAALLSISMVLPTTSGSAAAAFAVTPKDVTTHKATATEPTATPDSKATPPILETDVASASNGCTMLGIYGSYYSQAQEALDKLNEIRKEACEAGNIPDPRDPSRMLTSDDYKPLRWSRDLESIARIRAAEAGISFNFMASGHDRPSDKDTFSLSFHGVSSNCEDLAYCWGKSMTEGVLLWKSEQKDWVDQNLSNETGHYKSMINPKYNYVGLGDFYSEAAPYPNTVAGEFSTRTGLNETMQDVQTDVIQKVEISNKYIKENFLDGTDTIKTEQTSSLTAKVRLELTRSNGKVSTREIWSVQPLTYSSSDRTIATVDNNGNVTGLTNGDVTITAKADNAIFATKTVHISCAHKRKETDYTPATCTKNGHVHITVTPVIKILRKSSPKHHITMYMERLMPTARARVSAPTARIRSTSLRQPRSIFIGGIVPPPQVPIILPCRPATQSAPPFMHGRKISTAIAIIRSSVLNPQIRLSFPRLVSYPIRPT